MGCTIQNKKSTSRSNSTGIWGLVGDNTAVYAASSATEQADTRADMRFQSTTHRIPCIYKTALISDILDPISKHRRCSQTTDTSTVGTSCAPNGDIKIVARATRNTAPKGGASMPPTSQPGPRYQCCFVVPVPDTQRESKTPNSTSI